MNKHSSLRLTSFVTFLISLALLVNGCFGGQEEEAPPSVPTGGKSTESLGPVVYKKVPNVIGMPLSAAKIKLTDTGFLPTVPGVYFGGGERYVSAQNPPAGSLVPQTAQSVISLTLVTPKVVVVASGEGGVASGEGGGGAGAGGGGAGAGGGGAGGETTTTTTEAPFADLYVASITTDPDEPDFGETTEVEITVTNRGTATSDFFILHFDDGASEDVTDDDASEDAADTCRFPERENKHNRGFAPGESRVFDCDNVWEKPGTYDMVAEIDFDVEEDDDDASEDGVLEDINSGNDTLTQPIKISGELVPTPVPTSTSTTSTTVPAPETTTTTIPPTTTLPPGSTTSSTVGSTSTTLTPLGLIGDPKKGALKFVYGAYKSSRLNFVAEYPLHWLKGVLDSSDKNSGEYFIDTYAGGMGNSIGVDKVTASGTDLSIAMQARIKEITEEAGVPPLFIQSTQLGGKAAYTYQVPSESAEQTTLETLSVQNGSIWRVTYKAEDLTYDVDQPIYDRFLKSFSAK